MRIKRFNKIFDFNTVEKYLKTVWLNTYCFTIDANNALENSMLCKYLSKIGFRFKNTNGYESNKSIYILRRYNGFKRKDVFHYGQKYDKAMSIDSFIDILKKDKYLYKLYLKNKM